MWRRRRRGGGGGLVGYSNGAPLNYNGPSDPDKATTLKEFNSKERQKLIKIFYKATVFMGNSFNR